MKLALGLCGSLLVAFSSPKIRPPQGANPHAEFARDLIEAIQEDDGEGEGDEALDETLGRAPYRAATIVYDLIYQAARGEAEEWALKTAQRIALALERDGFSSEEASVLQRLYAERDDEGGDHWRTHWNAAQKLAVEGMQRANAGNLAQAAQLLEQALEIAHSQLEAPGAWSRYARVLGRMLRDLGQLEQSREVLASAVEADELRAALAELCDGLKLLGEVEFRLGRYSSALERYESALHLAAETGELAPSKAELGALYANLGRGGLAKAYATAALEEARALGDSVRQSYALGILSSVHSARGEYAAALRILEESLVIAQRSEHPGSIGSLRVQRAGVLSEIGRYADAQAELQQALELLDPERERAQHAQALATLGTVLVDAHRPAEALPILERAAEAYERDANPSGHSEALHQLGRAALDLDRAREAAQAFRAARDLRDAERLPFGRSLSACGLGNALEQLGRYAEAEANYKEALGLLERHELPEISWRAQAGLARAAERDGRSGQALDMRLAAIDDIEHMRKLLEKPALRERFLVNKLELYRRVIPQLIEAGRTEEAFRQSEALKARTLVDLFIAGAQDSRASQETQETGSLHELRESEMLELENDVALARALERGCDPATIQLLSKGPERAGQVEIPERNLMVSGLASMPTERLAARLGEREVLLSFVIGASDSGVWVARNGAHHEPLRFVPLEVQLEEVRAWVERILRPMASLREGHTDIGNLVFDVRAARSLYAALIAPIRDQIEGCERLWIVPDDPLWQLPFALLVSEHEKRHIDPTRLYSQYAGCRFLIEDFELGYVPAAGLLTCAREPGMGSEEQFESSAGTPSGRTLAIGDPTPLPEASVALVRAREEARRICDRFGSDSRLLTAGQATESGVKGAVASASRIHFAVHGVLDDERPTHSRLALAPGGGEDGWLHAYEIQELKLSAPRVVLSACESLGSGGHGDGLLGLARAFLQAGAHSVVTNAWVVDDEASADFMSLYYTHAGEGDALGGLRQAQLEMMRLGRAGLAYVHPFFWAGTMHIGGS